jgi:L-alanine-DL-glutamate epimerase-like enolase superfamily enzyme
MLGGWNATSIGNAATLHVAAGVQTDTFALEHAPDGLYPRLSAHIASPLPELTDGRLPLPTEPGLSVELDEDVWSFAVAHAPHVVIRDGSGVA